MYWIVDDADRSPPVKNEPRFLEYLDGVDVEKDEIPPANPNFTPVGHFGELESCVYVRLASPK